MSNAFDVHIVPWEFTGTIDAGTLAMPVFRVPTDALGGGITILDGRAVANSTMAVGSCPNFLLGTCGTGATISFGAAIASNYLGTVATSGFTSLVEQTWTITTPFVDAGNHVVINAGAPLANAGTFYANGKIVVKGYISYVMGK
jgi:hypothetical protein